MTKRTLVAVGAALALVGSTATIAGTAPKSGPEKVWVTPIPTGTSVKHPGAIMFTGSFADHGRSVKSNATGKPTKHGTYELLTLKKGSILVNVSQDRETTHKTFNKTSCSGEVHTSEPMPIVRGTNAYAGIGGTFTMTATYAYIGSKKNGACTTNTTTTVDTFGILIGSGRVKCSREHRWPRKPQPQ